jgi:hypothetical protein
MTMRVMLLFLWGCQVAPVGEEFSELMPLADAVLLPLNQVAPPDIEPLRITFDQALPGQTTVLRVQGTQSWEMTTFAVGTRGRGAGPCPDVLGGECLDVLDPLVLGSDWSNVRGDATFSVDLPAGLAVGTELCFVAVVARGPQGIGSSISPGVCLPVGMRCDGEVSTAVVAFPGASDTTQPSWDGDGLNIVGSGPLFYTELPAQWTYTGVAGGAFDWQVDSGERIRVDFEGDAARRVKLFSYAGARPASLIAWDVEGGALPIVTPETDEDVERYLITSSYNEVPITSFGLLALEVDGFSVDEITYDRCAWVLGAP